MRAIFLNSEKRVESRKDTAYNIQTYGDRNDYPQSVKEIAEASGTGKSCLKIYSKFIRGLGFVDQNFYKAQINRKNQTTDYILTQIARDYADYGGFAIHVNYNLAYRIVEVQHVPFETIRFEKLDDNGQFNKLKTHPDWGRRNTAIRSFKKDDIKEFYFFNPDPRIIKQQIIESDGIINYNGQIFYYSDAGDKTYPSPIYDPVLTDMSTEEGIQNVKYRNVRTNFLPAAVVIDKRAKPENEEQKNDLKEVFETLQTDMNSNKLVLVETDGETDDIEIRPFKTENYDKSFDYSESSVQQNIGRVFMQPPVLRAEDVGGNFGAELITNAYDFYNSITESERVNIESVFEQIFRYFYPIINPSNNYSIAPLRFGGGNTSQNDNNNG